MPIIAERFPTLCSQLCMSRSPAEEQAAQRVKAKLNEIKDRKARQVGQSDTGIYIQLALNRTEKKRPHDIAYRFMPSTTWLPYYKRPKENKE